jgi:hypothetical protein
MSARDRALKQALDEKNLAKALQSVLPRKNNYCAVNYPELLSELQHFGVRERGQLRKLVLRNIHEAVRIDREPLDEMNTKIYREELGSEQYRFLERRQIFFGWEGLMRVIMELEFGDRYREFADKRDHAGPTNCCTRRAKTHAREQRR